MYLVTQDKKLKIDTESIKSIKLQVEYGYQEKPKILLGIKLYVPIATYQIILNISTFEKCVLARYTDEKEAHESFENLIRALKDDTATEYEVGSAYPPETTEPPEDTDPPDIPNDPENPNTPQLELSIVPANLTHVVGEEPPAYGQATIYTTDLDKTTNTITITATGLQQTVNANDIEGYWVGIGISKYANAEYAWGFGDIPEQFVPNQNQPGAGRTQMVNGEEYTTLYWGIDSYDNINGFAQVKIDDIIISYNVVFDIEVL